MSLVEKIVEQFACPTGFWGNIVGFIMAHRSSNLERNEWAISLLNLQPSDRVLEIGFGPGVTIQKMSEIAIDGVIWGIDRSEVMFRQASKRNQRAISAGRVRLFLTSVSQLPSFDSPFDKILAVNNFYFWDNKTEVLRRLREQLRTGGIIALVHQPRLPGTTEDDVIEAGEKFSRYLEMAGFKDIQVERKRMKPVSTVYVQGRNL
ncbi:class I SAM-dependent methyltransferase [Candidatus Gracilibacteria bacterium]|jgi:cyclopropane fatty-acyl-phospholipid synthase-like methyltransferase|nr:class I SAM-dependent methyltransferase [Candidatus Gracilibacteria bacterium]NJM87661.1 class I SAM-dependent methyltransferase [Hydrococcus sp. RU_2_2]NJP20285.1 class I SAM-dependent methyltransferase [Hydrococcus sp. CRU_1_1]